MSYDLCLHVDANDPAVLAFAFVNARNYMNGLPGKEFELVLVANGPAVKLFVPAQAELQKTAEELMARGLKLRLCKNALDANKMTAADLWPGCEVVPAGLVEIVELQNKSSRISRLLGFRNRRASRRRLRSPPDSARTGVMARFGWNRKSCR